GASATATGTRGTAQHCQSERLHDHQGERKGMGPDPEHEPATGEASDSARAGEGGKGQRRHGRASAQACQPVEVGDGADLGAEQEEITNRDGKEVAAATRLGEGDGRFWAGSLAL